MTPILNFKKSLQSWLREQGVDVSLANISQSQLRADQTLGQQSTVSFTVTETKGNAGSNVTERRLSNNDIFIVTDISLTLKKCADTAAGHQAAILHSFNNPNVFNEANDGNLQAIYNGDLSIEIDQVKFLPSMPVRDFERVHTSQEGTVTDATAPIYSIARSEKISVLDGYCISDLLAFDGTMKVNPLINVGESINMAGVANPNFATLLLKGFLVSNAKFPGSWAKNYGK